MKHEVKVDSSFRAVSVTITIETEKELFDVVQELGKTSGFVLYKPYCDLLALCKGLK